MEGTAEYLRRAFGDSVFTTAMALEVGVTARRLNYAARKGEVLAVGQGKYCLPTPGTDTRAVYLRRVEAALARRPDAVIAGVSAAAWWELPCPDPWGNWLELPVVLGSDRQIHGGPGLMQFRLGIRRLAVVRGRTVTDLPTTAVDVARHLPEPQALIVVDAVARRLAGTSDRGLLGGARARTWARDLLARAHADQNGPGLIRARRVLGWADPAADSPPESFIRGHVLLAGLPAPVVNAPVAGASGKRYYVDLLWPESAVGLEVDGKLKYTDRDVVYREHVRHRDIEDTGLDLLRAMAEVILGNPSRVVGNLRAAI